MPKKIILLVSIVIVLIFSYNLIGQIFNFLRSGDRLQTITDKLHQLEIKNKELKNRLAEVKSLEFVEKQARDKLGLAKEGETVIIIPEEKINQVLGEKKEEEPRLPNWEGWLKLFWK